MSRLGWARSALGAACAISLCACGAGISDDAGDGGRPVGDGGGAQSGISGPGASRDGAAGAAAPEAVEACGRAEVSANRVIPTVWLFIDGSGSMGAAMDGSAGGMSRWSILREALLASGTGLVPRLQSSVAFGLFAYDGGLSLPGVKTPACPRVLKVDPATDNLASIEASYPLLPMGASTPTHYALVTLSEQVQKVALSAPTYVVLATDGKPNLCDFHDGVPESLATEQEAVATVADLAGKGIKTFAISMAEGDSALTSHLNDVARAGATGEPVFTPSTSDGLVAALEKIFTQAATCDVALQGTIVPGSECRGDVRMNGVSLACGQADGYRVKEDHQTLELLGSACHTLKHDPRATLEASFPCGEVVLL